MFQRIKNYFSREYSRTLTKNSKDKRISLSSVAGRLLIIFFLAMFIFTFVSRAAASFTVAKVSVSSPERNRLLYSISGIGEIIPSNEELLHVESGYRIDDVYVSVGEKVNKDTVLFCYNMKDLKDKYDTIENDIEKIKLQISMEKLRQQSTEGVSIKPYLMSIEHAEENLEVAKKKLAEAKRDYEDSMHKAEKKEDEIWQKEHESRQKQYNKALREYESLVFRQEKQLKQSARAIDDAKAKLLQANDKNNEINPLIDNYIEALNSKDKGLIYFAEKVIFESFYGEADSYEQHKDAVFNMALSAQQDGYYLWYLKNSFLRYEEQLYTTLNSLENAKNSRDQSDESKQSYEYLKERYLQAWQDFSLVIGEYEKQINLIESDLDVKSGELKKLRRDDKKLKEYLEALALALEKKADIKDSRKKLYDFVMGDKAKLINEEVDIATQALTRAEEDYELLKKEYDLEREDLQLEITELKDAVVSMENETYDSLAGLESKEQAVKAAEEAVRLAEQTVETNKLQYEITNNQNSNEITTQTAELNLQSYYMDIHKKEKEGEEVSKLIESSGEMLSPYEGVITHIGLEAGRSTTGEEIIKVGTGNYVFKGAFTRDENISIELGGGVDISLAGNARAIESEIGKVSINTDGMTEFISSLPQVGDYYLGKKAEFKISTESEQFNQCIPIQALREDNYGYYVLVIGEQEDILGMQIIAERRNVNLLAKGTSVAAVEGLIGKSQIITDSNKYINAGDRVRIE